MRVKRSAFSLAETMVSVGLLSFILASFFAVWYVWETSWFVDMGLLDLQQGSRRAMDGMVRELRGSETKDITIGAAGDSIVFSLPQISSNTVSYYRDAASRRLVREHPAGNAVAMTGDVSDIDFCCMHGASCTTDCSGSTALRITLNVSKTAKKKPLTFSLVEKVRLRNE